MAVGLFGLLPQTKSGNNVVLVMTDHFTCWCYAIPLQDDRDATVVRALDGRAGFCLLWDTREDPLRPGSAVSVRVVAGMQ